MTSEVLEPNWHQMEQKLTAVRFTRCGYGRRTLSTDSSVVLVSVSCFGIGWLCAQAKTIDEVLAAHQNFLDSLLKGCMLTNMDLFKARRFFSLCVIGCLLAAFLPFAVASY
jgi:hypothetical protein